MASRRPSREALALLGLIVGIVGAIMFAYSFTPPIGVCNSGTGTIEVHGEMYGFTTLCGPDFVSPQHTYALAAGANASVDLFLIEGRQYFLDSLAGYPCCNLSDAQAFIESHPETVGFQVLLTPTPSSFNYFPRTNTSIILVFLNSSPNTVSVYLTAALYFQPVPVGVYLLAGLLVTPAGIILTLPYFFGRRRSGWTESREQIGP